MRQVLGYLDIIKLKIRQKIWSLENPQGFLSDNVQEFIECLDIDGVPRIEDMFNEEESKVTKKIEREKKKHRDLMSKNLEAFV